MTLQPRSHHQFDGDSLNGYAAYLAACPFVRRTQLHSFPLDFKGCSWRIEDFAHELALHVLQCFLISMGNLIVVMWSIEKDLIEGS